jgi:hypothetical protein
MRGAVVVPLVMGVSGVALSVGPIAVATAPAGAREVPLMGLCKTLHAAHWKFGHKGGNTWYVTTISPTSCGFAERWGATLSHEKADSKGNYSKFPSGYLCAGPLGNASTPGEVIGCHQEEGQGSFTINPTG